MFLCPLYLKANNLHCTLLALTEAPQRTWRSRLVILGLAFKKAVILQEPQRVSETWLTSRSANVPLLAKQTYTVQRQKVMISDFSLCYAFALRSRKVGKKKHALYFLYITTPIKHLQF